MRFKEIVEPVKSLYKFEPGYGENSFSRALSIRIHEIFAQKCGLNATEDLGFLGCCAVARVTDLVPEVWIDFKFSKASTADRNEYTGKAAYFPKKEFKELENYLFVGDVLKNSKVIMRDIPVINNKGEVEDVIKNVGVLRIYGQLALCLAVVVNVNILNPDFLVRFSFTERGNRFMNEYVDPSLINSYLPIDVSVTVKNSDSDDNRFDVDKAIMAIQEGHMALIATPSAGTAKKAVEAAEQPVTKSGKKAGRAKKEDNKSNKKEEKAKSDFRW